MSPYMSQKSDLCLLFTWYLSDVVTVMLARFIRFWHFLAASDGPGKHD